MANPQVSLENTEEVPQREVRAQGACSFSLSLQGKNGAVLPPAEGGPSVDGHLVQPGQHGQMLGPRAPPAGRLAPWKMRFSLSGLKPPGVWLGGTAPRWAPS